MRTIKCAILCCVMATSSAVAHADQLMTQLRISVDTFAIRRINAETPTRVIFVGTPVKAQVSFVAAALPSAKTGPLSIALPSKQWWNELSWEVDRKGAAKADIRPRVTDTPPQASELKSGDRLVAHFDLGELPPGEYRLRVRLGDVRSDVEWFLVSNGQENADLRREFARYNVDRSPDKASLQKNLLALAAADPLNASAWIRLGDLALPEGSAEQIRGYYDKAAEVLGQRRERFAAEGQSEVAAAIENERKMILSVRDAVPAYVANRATTILHPDLEGGRHYVLRERASGRVLRTISAPASRDEH